MFAKNLILSKSLILSLSKDDPAGGTVRARWNVLRQAQDEVDKLRTRSTGSGRGRRAEARGGKRPPGG